MIQAIVLKEEGAMKKIMMYKLAWNREIFAGWLHRIAQIWVQMLWITYVSATSAKANLCFKQKKVL